MQAHPLNWQVWRRRLIRAILIVGLLLMLCGVHRGWQIYQHLLQLRAHLSGIRSLSLSSVDSLDTNLAQLQGDVALLRRDLRLPLAVAPHLGWAPVIGPTVRAAPALFSFGESLLVATGVVWGAIEKPVSDALSGACGVEESMARLSAQILERSAELEQATREVHEAGDLVSAIDASRLVPQLSERVGQLQSLTPLLTTAFDSLVLLPKLASQPGDQTYLLLAQNDDELRPTGGFISGIGALTVTQGIPHFVPLVDSYRVEDWNKPHPDPPEALREYMGLDLWVTRDANWWPDFPTSARAVSDLYKLNQGQQVNGVLAVDMTAVAKLLEVLTPLELPGGKRLESGQVRKAMHDSWSLPPEALATQGLTITATRPFTAVELRLSYNRHKGKAWFDSVRLEDLQHPGANLVRNPSFEDDLDQDGRPDGWQAVDLTDKDRLVTDHAHSGRRSLLIVGDPQSGKAVVQRISLSGDVGTELLVAAESRAEDIEWTGGLYALTATLLDDQGQAQSVVARFPNQAHDWASAGTLDVQTRWMAQRKGFMNEFAGAALHKFLADPSSVPWLGLLTTILNLLDQRHIQIYSSDPSIQALLQRHGWAGALAETSGDSLLVVDSNVGYNKVSPSIEQSIDYDVVIEPSGRVRSRLVIRYDNRSRRTIDECDKFNRSAVTYDLLTEGCYWDYVRIYVPAGAQLQSNTGGDEPVRVLSELGRTTFATSITLRPGERRELCLEYLLPILVAPNGTYQIYVQKQAGTNATPLRVSITASNGLTPQPESLQPDDLSPNRAIYATNLLVDRRAAVTVGP